MKQILLTDGLLQETVTGTMKLYKDMEAMVHSHGGDSDFFYIVACVLLRATLAPYILII